MPQSSPMAAGGRQGSRSLFDPSPDCGEGEEHRRLAAADAGTEPWRKWGPYVSERQWGTCREDYGSDGNSWAYLGFQEAHQAAYRWGEDGIAGFCDEEQRLCLSVAMWNGQDPILKERLFGLSGPQGNHGEDVKEMYYYLDATPTNSYLKMLYKYPQKAFPYDEIRRKSATLGCTDPEYELMDTGIFDDDRYFDVTTEYARGGVDDILLRVTATNRGPDDAELHLAPQAFFRNTWSWAEGSARPGMELAEGPARVLVRHGTLGEYHLFAEEGAEIMFCENESNAAALEAEGCTLRPFDYAGDPPPPPVAGAGDPEPEPADELPEEDAGPAAADPAAAAPAGAAAPGTASEKFAPPARAEGAGAAEAAGAAVAEEGAAEATGAAGAEEGAAEAAAPAAQDRRRLYQASGIVGPGPYRDAFHRRIVLADESAVARKAGTKVGFYTRLSIPAGGSKTVRLRLSRDKLGDAMADFDSTFASRIEEADEFYDGLQIDLTDPDCRMIQRQALAGMIWTKQFYYYDIHTFLEGDPACPKLPEARRAIRHGDWDHMVNCDIISMPDKWEFPWYATWDLAFHMLPMALVDPGFAKGQLLLLTREWYMHPNGQLPAFEWNFSDVNPPVHAWATWRVFQMERKRRGDDGDLFFLEEVFHKLMINFTWWVNRKDAEGRNIFQGGFLGLDNIGVFDRGGELPTGGFINQSDGTSWMAFYSLTLMRIALELAMHNPVYESIAAKFFEHFLHIARSMTRLAEGLGLWDEKDEFYYDVLTTPDGSRVPLRVRSMVGLIPLFAVEVLEPEVLDKLPKFASRCQELLDKRPDLAVLVSEFEVPGVGNRRLLSLLRGQRMKSLLRRMLDPKEFLSDYGVRALSRVHLEEPYVLEHDGKTYQIGYEPAEASVRIMGGNSNWRGPIWFPMNYLIIESLQKFHQYYGADYLVECPVASGKHCSILAVAEELSRRLLGLFRSSEEGRPALRLHPKMAQDPHFRDHLLFYEHFHGDNGRGVGASHQTGWTGLVAKLIQAFGDTPGEGASRAFERMSSV